MIAKSLGKSRYSANEKGRKTVDTVWSPDWAPLEKLRAVERFDYRIEETTQVGFRCKQPPEIRGSGYVAESLEAALWAFHDAPDFATVVLKAVNLSYDTNTTGANSSQLAAPTDRTNSAACAATG